MRTNRPGENPRDSEAWNNPSLQINADIYIILDVTICLTDRTLRGFSPVGIVALGADDSHPRFGGPACGIVPHGRSTDEGIACGPPPRG